MASNNDLEMCASMSCSMIKKTLPLSSITFSTVKELKAYFLLAPRIGNDIT